MDNAPGVTAGGVIAVVALSVRVFLVTFGIAAL